MENKEQISKDKLLDLLIEFPNDLSFAKSNYQQNINKT